MTGALQSIASVDDLFAREPLARFEALIAGPNFDGDLRAEPITFDSMHPIYGNACRVPGCRLNSTQATWWCTRHSQARNNALRGGISHAEWLAGALPFSARRRTVSIRVRLPACRFCPDRDATVDGLCRAHAGKLGHSRQGRPEFDEAEWAARQVALPGSGDCLVADRLGRGESDPPLCTAHRGAWSHGGKPAGAAMKDWLLRRSNADPAALFLTGLEPLLAAEIRYALWTHTKNAAPARWHPMWLRTLVKSCRRRGVSSLLELDPADSSWTTNPAAVNRIVREMLKDVLPVHHSRQDTRELGYIDPNYWGFRFPDRRSPFDLTAISRRWLRDLAWDYLASELDGSRRPRTSGPFEGTRRAIICFDAYLTDRAPSGGRAPSLLSDFVAKDFSADLRRRVSNAQPLPGVFNVSGAPSIAAETTYPIVMNALRRTMRWALDSGMAETAGIPREFIVAIPHGGAMSFKNPRPFADDVLRELSDPANIRLFDNLDPHDMGLGDIWSIQVQCGRRIGEVVKLRLDCVGEHLGRTWLWVDMTKVGKLDYAVQVPRGVFDLIRGRQAKTIERFRLQHGVEPTAKQQRAIALFPSRVTNPTFKRSISASAFSVSFREWLALDQINLPGHTTHQARHSLATRLTNAGASMTHVKRVLGHVSARRPARLGRTGLPPRVPRRRSILRTVRAWQ